MDTQPYLTQFSWPAQFEQPEQAGQAEIRLEPYFLGHDFIDLPSILPNSLSTPCCILSFSRKRLKCGRRAN